MSALRKASPVLVIGALLVGGCGGTNSFRNDPRPPVPANLTVYINNRSVSVSPAQVGAGQVTFIVTNQASSAQSLEVLAPGQTGTPLATTGPINPMATTSIDVDFASQGEYVVATGPSGTTSAAQATPSTIRPATVQVGPSRPNGTNRLLVP